MSTPEEREERWYPMDDECGTGGAVVWGCFFLPLMALAVLLFLMLI